MDDIYQGIFSMLYEIEVGRTTRSLRPFGFAGEIREQQEDFLLHRLRDIIEQTSDAVLSQTGKLVRADAKYFLLLNILEMIARPVILARRESTGRVLELAAGDVRNLITDAAEKAETEVSAHGIVDALSRNWKRLKVSDIRVWDGGPSPSQEKFNG